MTSRLQWREVPRQDPHHRAWMFENTMTGEYLGHVEQFSDRPETPYAWAPTGRIGVMRGMKNARRAVKIAAKLYMNSGRDWVAERSARLRKHLDGRRSK